MLEFVDHLILFTPDLEAGCEFAAARLGHRPLPGGRHPDLGTHNALLGLGPSCYLEVMAPDPQSERPADPPALGLATLEAPRLVTWVLGTRDIERLHRDAAGAAGLGPIQAGQRRNPDDSLLRWRFTSPFAFPCHGVLPFVIDWDDTPHPGSVLPTAGRLKALSLEHPDPGAVEAGLRALGASVPVAHRPQPRILATIETENGLVTLA